MFFISSLHTIAVGSQNPVKLGAVRDAFTELGYPDVTILGVDEPMMRGIDHQPLTRSATEQGAKNRAAYAIKNTSDADIAFGLEGGVYVDEESGQGFLFGVVAAVDRTGYEHVSYSGNILLPDLVTKRLLVGEELGPVFDETIHTQNIKQGLGTSGYLLGGVVPRQMGFMINVIQTLVPRLHHDKGRY